MSFDTETKAPLRRGRAEQREVIAFVGPRIERFSLPREGVVVVGRGADADVQIDEPSLSRHHVKLYVGTSLLVEDLRSSNGTEVAGAQVKPGKPVGVEEGAVILLGDVSIVVRGLHDEDDTPAPMSKPQSSMDAVHKLVDLAAPSDLSVLLLGETGVGKEVVAERVHAKSRRAKKRFVKINCAAIPETMIESELFGHERGAFTGAVAPKPGLLESGDEGTVLLDEIGELPLSMQAKLLRALESGEVQRVGATSPRKIDVRVIAATHAELPALVERGAFRADLYFRLDGLTIHIPPLRDRRPEIPSLAKQFAREMCDRSDRARVRLTDAAIARLLSHEWPGNVRELRKVIERAVVLSRGDSVDAEHLVFGAVGRKDKGAPSGAADPIVPASPPPEADARPLKEVVGDEAAAVERKAILDALDACNGNQTRAAAKLGIARRTLIDRIERYNLPRPRKG